MRGGWIRVVMLTLALCGGAAARADDRDVLTAFLEDSLSGAGRVVTVTGFEGTLSSQAQIARLTIADDQGIWLTLKGVTLDWNRAALLGGTLSVNRLAAAEIDLDRLPQTQTRTAGALPSPEAAPSAPFALPSLPVAVSLGEVSAQTIVLGPAVLGQAVTGRLKADASLVDGQGHIRLALDRTDGKEGSFSLIAVYANATGELTLSLDAREAAGGIAVQMLGIPGAPSAHLVLDGKGPLDAFSASLTLQTDGETRAAGSLQTTRADAGADAGATAFIADLAGNIAPLFTPDHAAFFGPSVSMHAEGRRGADGVLELSALSLSSQALSLNGSLRIAADGLPDRVNLTGRLAQPDGRALLLPWPGMPTRLGKADLDIGYDRSRGPDWTADVTATDIDRPDMKITALNLHGTGRLQHGEAAGLTAVVTLNAVGLRPTDPALAQATGDEIDGKVTVSWQSGSGKLAFSDLSLRGGDAILTADGSVDSRLRLDGRLSLQAGDLGRFAGLAGRPLGGAARIDLAGWVSPPSGPFDADLTLAGQGLRIGLAPADGLLSGVSQIALSARRDATGTLIRKLTIEAGGLTAELGGRIASAGSSLSGQVALADLSALRPGWKGALTATTQVTGSLMALKAEVQATSEGLGVGQVLVDRLIGGSGKLTGSVQVRDNRVVIDAVDFATPQLQLTASGQPEALTVRARLADLSLILPEFPGVLTAEGQLRQTASGTALDLVLRGPGQVDARLAGSLSPDLARADLAASGSAQAGLANVLIAPRVIAGRLDFDLALKGPLQLSGLTGSVTLSNGRLADPDQPASLVRLEARALLAGATATIAARSDLTSGGKIEVKGRVGLTPPMAADLAIALDGAVLSDPQLYRTSLSGDLTLVGPVLGGARIAGRIALGPTELRIPSSGITSLPVMRDLRHLEDAADVRATRVRAGLEGASARRSAGGGAYGLDLLILAPNQIFIRGRGLDVEMGGRVQLRGTTAAIVPSGALTLIRGRLDLLGKRLDLSEATLQMQGALVPYVRVAATTQSDGFSISAVIEGDATDPGVTFTSSPELPQEEVLARLLFDRGLSNLSPFQTAQLASAVATLAGRGGEGLIGRLRRSAGLDNLDVLADATGKTRVTLGKYLSTRLYSEATVDQTGKGSVTLNFDASRHVTLRGSLDDTGQTGLGLYLERDY